MKKILLLILILISISPLTTNFPRNVDPSQIREEKPSPLQLLNIYSSIGISVGNLDFKSSYNFSNLLKDIYIPQDILYIYHRSRDLLNETLNYMNITKHHIDLASKYIIISDIAEAEKHIQKAYENFALVKLRFNEIQDVYLEFSDRIGITHVKISEVLNDIRSGIDKIEKSIEDLHKKVENIKLKLIKTFLDINVYPLKITPGEEITINGLLYYENNATLPFREIVINVGSKKYIVETNELGIYSLKCNVFEYISNIQIYAEYIPKGDDIEKYSYSKSDIVYLNVEFIKPKINIAISPIKVKPMDKFNITINTIPNLRLNIQLFNSSIDGYSDENGLFKVLNLIVPSNIAEGYHNVFVKNFPRDVIGPSSNITKIIVYKLDPKVEIDFPSIALSGFPIQVKVSTDRFSKISIKSSDIGVSYVDEGLNVSRIIVIPITFLGEYVKFNVEIDAKEPYVKNYQTTIQIKVVNTPTTIILLIISIIMFLNYLKTIKIKQSKIKGEVEVTTPKIAMKEMELPYITRLFYDLIDLVRISFGVIIRASDTIREYLSRLKPIVPQKLFNLLNGVLMRYEEFIYGKPEHRESEENVIEDLRDLIDRLKGGGE